MNIGDLEREMCDAPTPWVTEMQNMQSGASRNRRGLARSTIPFSLNCEVGQKNRRIMRGKILSCGTGLLINLLKHRHFLASNAAPQFDATVPDLQQSRKIAALRTARLGLGTGAGDDRQRLDHGLG